MNNLYTELLSTFDDATETTTISEEQNELPKRFNEAIQTIRATTLSGGVGITAVVATPRAPPWCSGDV